MQLLLAPMEGLLDFALRDTLTRVVDPGRADTTGLPPAPHPSGVDRCVSEFIRITDTLLPARAFVRTVPELLTGGRTLAGVPVRGQLLGSDPVLMAENAARLAELGSPGVDLNFGCPAKVVNRHGGGAALLDDPEQVHRIVAAVRRAVPLGVPVSAKMRLGVDDDRRALDNALAIEAAGASEIVVHARTKAHGYRPPAYWDRIADLRPAVRLPLIANGEIWTAADALRAQAASGCTHLMLGRGQVADPGLALAIRHAVARAAAGGVPDFEQKLPLAHFPIDFVATEKSNAGRPGSACGFRGPLQPDRPPLLGWGAVVPLLQVFWARVEARVERRHRAGRLKQWLNLMRRRHPEAQRAFDELRTVNDPAELALWLQRQRATANG